MVRRIGMGFVAGVFCTLLCLGLRSFLKARRFGLGFREWVLTLTDRELNTFWSDLDGTFMDKGAHVVSSGSGATVDF